jgi:Ca2+/H+ antiporter
MRQATPFREGLWNETRHGEKLAQTMFLHWRLARRCGYTPDNSLAAFERGSAALALLAESLDADIDSFEQGLADTRVVAAAVDFRQRVGLTAFPRFVRRMLTSFDTLTHISYQLILEKSRQDAGNSNRNHLRDSSRGVWPKLLVLMLSMVGISTLVHILGSRSIENHWIEPLAAAVILVLVFAYILVLELARRQHRRDHRDE